jgi:Protein of unknown function (DUF2470)
VPIFSDEIVNAVVDHMNGDHPGDNLLIAQAFGDADAETSELVGLDEHEATFVFTVAGDQRLLDVPWPAGEIAERSDIRREIVVLYERACSRLGVTPRPH